MKVRWTESALEQLDSIHDYIARNSEIYAKRMVEKITRRTMRIADHPLSGRRVAEYDLEQIREVIEAPYRIIYYIMPDQVDIIAVLHGAMNVLRDGQ